MPRRVLAALLACLSAAACATSTRDQFGYDPAFESSDRGALSRYYTPESEGGGESRPLYAYGNFCGPGRPFAEGNPDNLSRTAEVEPVDSIDRACKLHDMCYMRFGADSIACDTLANSTSTGAFNHLTRPLAHQCFKQAREVLIGVQVKWNGLGRSAQQSLALLALPLLPLDHMSTGYRESGFPSEPGHCWMSYADDPNAPANAYMGVNTSNWMVAMPAGTRTARMAAYSRLLARDSALLEMTRLGALAERRTNTTTYYDVQHFLHTGELRVISSREVERMFGRPSTPEERLRYFF